MERTVTLGAELGGVRCVHTVEVAQARRLLADEGTYRGLADLFAAFADTTRAKIVHTLVRQERR